MRFVWIFLAAIGLPGFLVAQTHPHRTCGTMEHHQHLLETHPELQDAHDRIEQHNNHFTQELASGKTTAVVTIPVVVHVVYRTAAENISDAQIQSQLAVLNNDFRRLNADRTNTPSAFSGIVADCEINFCLAQRTPTGAATTGIVRRQTTVTSFGSNDAVKYTAQGGSDAWPASQYLNIWVCNLGGGLLGYAQFPGGPAATDGVVIGYLYFGTTGTATAPYNKGRTATHEVGHWLNLRHIWGDGTCASDLVADTPTQQGPNYSCPSHPRPTCSNSGDMFMNYMDYTDDGCMNAFTAGQKARMQALFASGGARASLVTSLGCVPPAAATCPTPTGLAASSITTSSATLSWAAATGATSYNVRFRAVGSSTWTTGSATATSASLTGLAAATQYEAQVQAVCSGGATGSFSASATFTTSSTSTCGSDAYEANNTSTAAKTIAANAYAYGLICPASDVDWFQFANTSTARYIRITLDNLPADYDVYLYNSSGTLLRSSENGGTTAESIVYNTSTVGTYRIRVVGYNGATSASQQYRLRASISSSAFRTAEPEADADPAPPAVAFYPNPTQGLLNIRFEARQPDSPTPTVVVRDLLGRVALQHTAAFNPGQQTLELDLGALPNGLYLVSVLLGDTQHTQRVEVMR